MIKYSGKEMITSLFKKLDIQYIEDYIIKYPELKKHNSFESDYYRDNRDEFDSLYNLFKDEIKNRNTADIFISSSENRGYGLFANSDIRENSFIGVYLGIIKVEDEFVEYDDKGYDTDYAWDYPDEIDGFPLLEINAKYSGNELRFANHDREPNLKVEHTIVDNYWYIFFLADRDIKKDEELTISYGEAYWSTEYREQI
jgi:hypothetical protein